MRSSEHMLELVRVWLERDIFGADAPAQRALGGVPIPRSDAFSDLGRRVVTSLGTGELTDLSDWLHRGGTVGQPDELILHAVQLLCARAVNTLGGAPTPEPTSPPVDAPRLLRERADAVIRTVVGAQLHRMRSALPREGDDFLELAAVLKDTLYSTLASGLVRYVSPGIAELSGHPPAAFLADQHLWASLVIPEDLPRMRDAFHAVLRGEPSEAIYRIRHSRTDRIHHVLDRSAPVCSGTEPGSEVVRIDGILIDMTERLELEMRLERSETLRSLGQLARDIAHDFNNLLVSILGHADMLAARLEPDSRDARSLRLISAAAEKGSQLTDRLLTFARGSACSRDKLPTDLAPLVLETAELASPSLPAHLRIDTRIAPLLPPVAADALRLGESLLNLAVNAIHACSGQFGTRILLETRLATDDEARRIGSVTAVVLSVSDDGPGMSADVRARVFEPLFTTRAKTGGTGLGCAIAYGVAVDHGGVLEVDSEPGHGAEFRFILPHLAPTPDGVGDTRVASASTRDHLRPPTNPVGHAIPAPPERSESAGPRRILVVDDEPSVRQLLKDLLEGAGYPVDAVAGGEEAVDSVRLAPGSYALVILDVMMQPVDGTETFVRLRSAWPNLPIIFCTGHSDSERLADPGALERARVVRKPFRAAHIIRAVREATVAA
ncbi:MAG: response regulator [Myxococcota bacterium]